LPGNNIGHLHNKIEETLAPQPQPMNCTSPVFSFPTLQAALSFHSCHSLQVAPVLTVLSSLDHLQIQTFFSELPSRVGRRIFDSGGEKVSRGNV
jgi:hypothetical protein